MNEALKENGRIFKVIKYRVLGYEEHVKSHSLDKIGDIYKERNDGWFRNMRNENGLNIFNIDDYSDYYEEVTE